MGIEEREKALKLATVEAEVWERESQIQSAWPQKFPDCIQTKP